MFTYSLAWDTAFNTDPTAYAELSFMQFYKRAQEVLKIATKAGSDHIKINHKIC